MQKSLSIMEIKTNMQYEGLRDYAKTHTMLECAEKYNCSYACMRSYIYKHKITYKQQIIQEENNPNYKHGGKIHACFIYGKIC